MSEPTNDARTAAVDWESKPEPWRTIGLRARMQFRQLAAGETVTPPPAPSREPRPPEQPVVALPAEPALGSKDIRALRAGLKFCSADWQPKIRARIAELLTQTTEQLPAETIDTWEQALATLGPIVRIPHYGPTT